MSHQRSSDAMNEKGDGANSPEPNGKELNLKEAGKEKGQNDTGAQGSNEHNMRMDEGAETHKTARFTLTDRQLMDVKLKQILKKLTGTGKKDKIQKSDKTYVPKIGLAWSQVVDNANELMEQMEKGIQKKEQDQSKKRTLPRSEMPVTPTLASPFMKQAMFDFGKETNVPEQYNDKMENDFDIPKIEEIVLSADNEGNVLLQPENIEHVPNHPCWDYIQPEFYIPIATNARAWFNNETIMTFLGIMTHSLESEKKCIIVSSYYDSRADRDVREENVFFGNRNDFDLALINIFLGGNHWAIGLYNRNKTVIYCDPMNENGTISVETSQHITAVVEDITNGAHINVEIEPLKASYDQRYDMAERRRYVNRQVDGYSCGVHACVIAETYIREGCAFVNDLNIAEHRERIIDLINKCLDQHCNYETHEQWLSNRVHVNNVSVPMVDNDYSDNSLSETSSEHTIEDVDLSMCSHDSAITLKDKNFAELALNGVISQSDASFMKLYYADFTKNDKKEAHIMKEYNRIRQIIYRSEVKTVSSKTQEQEEDRKRKSQRRSGMSEDERNKENEDKKIRYTQRRSGMSEEDVYKEDEEKRERERQRYEDNKKMNHMYKEAIETIVVNRFSVGQFGTTVLIDNDDGEEFEEYIKCNFCNALFFKDELKSNNKKGVYDACCNKGNVTWANMKIDHNKPFPRELKDLFLNQDKLFMDNIRRINGDFAFGSMYANTYDFDKFSKYNCYRIHGQVYRNLKLAAEANDGSQPRGGQLFFYDEHESVEIRKKRTNCPDTILAKIESCIRRNNPYAEGYKFMKEVIDEQSRLAKDNDDAEPEIKLMFGVNASTDDRTKNLQTVNEIAAIFVPDAEGNIPQAKIVIHKRSNDYQNIPHYDEMAEALIYPLLKPCGGGSWYSTKTKEKDKKMTIGDYYKFWIAYRHAQDFFNPLQYAGRLFQQWIVDQYCRIEQDRLMWYRLNQEKIKAAEYKGLHDMMQKMKTNLNAKEIGRTIILPSDYVGGPRHETESYYDDMAIVGEKGKPHLFITYTCNGKDPDIIAAINSCSKGGSENHPTMVCRVFKLKLDQMMDDINKGHIFGKVKAHCYKIEFQKRGLPHAHILVTLAKGDKWTEDKIDKNGIWAHIPQREETSQLFREKKELELRERYEKIQNGKIKIWKYRADRELYAERKDHNAQKTELDEEFFAIRNGQDKTGRAFTPDDYVEKLETEFYYELREQVGHMCHNLCSVKILGPHPCRKHMPCESCSKMEKNQRTKNCDECTKRPTYCTKEFPKNYREQMTEFTDDSYPNYKRPSLTETDEIKGLLDDIREGKDTKSVIMAKKRKVKLEAKMFYFGSKLQFCTDNRWIVPYNPWLLMKYRSHINVELVASIKSVKYLFKYIHKGFDKANVKFAGEGDEKIVYDEINRYQEMRYIGPTEAAWRMLQFHMHDKSHHVERLICHIENEHPVYFDEDDTVEKIKFKMQNFTKLTAFFDICNKFKLDKPNLEKRIHELKMEHKYEPEYKKKTEIEHKIETHLLITMGMHYNEKYHSKHKDLLKCYEEKGIKLLPDDYTIQPNSGLLYKDFPKYFTWHKDSCTWALRKSYFKTLGRVYSVSPGDSTGRFHLRILLFHVKSPKSFDDLKTVNGKQEDTFQKACLAHGIIDDDTEWIKSMEDAIKINTYGYVIRHFFALLLMHCNVAEPRELWEMFKSHMVKDITDKHPNWDETMIYDTALGEIYKILLNNDKVIDRDYHGMPPLDMEEFEKRQHNYDALQKQQKADEMRNKMNNEQKSVFEKMEKLLLNGDENDEGKCYYIYGPGGTGKSFIYEALCHLAMAHDKKVITTAFSGIAATILPNGMTNHKMLKLPLNVNNETESRIQLHMPEADLLRNADIIIWDEAPMSPKYILDICHRKLCEIMKNKLPFGGKIMLLGGDFRQVLPVLKYAIPAEVIDLCIKSSPLWRHFKVIHLVENMRANKDEKEFAQLLLDIGDGKANDENGRIRIPDQCIAKRPLPELVFRKAIQKQDWDSVKHRAILSPYNNQVDVYNDEILKMLPGEARTYQSYDTQEDVDGLPLPSEVLKGLNCANFPKGLTTLKIKAIIQILRNLILDKGLCNGTRLIIECLYDRILHCKIISGDKAGEEIFIPRITLTDEEHFDCKLNRKQFPVRLAFAMTINKSQGQTLDFVGLDLSREAFSHGQVYVGMSRVRSIKNLKVKLPNGREDKTVRNVVWKEVL